MSGPDRAPILDHLRAEGLIAAALGLMLGQDVPAGQTSAVRCLNPEGHQNGDEHPSAIAKPDVGRVDCSICGLQLGLLDVGIRTGYGQNRADVAARLDAHFRNNGHAAAGTNGKVPQNPSKDHPKEFRAARQTMATLLARPGAERLFAIIPRAVIEDLQVGALPRYAPLGRPPSLVFPAYGKDGLTITGTKRRYLTPYDHNGQTLKSQTFGNGLLCAPQLAVKPDATAILAAGETDMMRGCKVLPELAWLSSSTGEGTSLRPWAQLFEGRDVVVIYDADEAGKKGAARVARDLAEHAARIRIVSLPLPGTPDDKDLSDWIAAHPDDTAEELRKLIEAAPEFGPADAPDVPEGASDWSQDSLALDLTRHWGDARYVAVWGRWFFGAGATWKADEQLEHMTRTRAYLRGRADGLLQGDPDGKARKAAKTIRAATTVAAVASLARSNPECAAGVDQWDRDPWLLGTPAGTVDLRTGKLLGPRLADYITKMAACAPAPEGTRSELWESFLERITARNADLIDYIQRFCGYSLTGSVREHAFPFMYGSGQNGKTVLLNTIQGVMGDYAATIPTEILMVSPGDRHPTELARLRGVRLAIASETEDGKRWAEARLKSLTGGERIAARYMRQDFFEFDPTFKIVVAGNHMPSLRGVDKAIRRRLHFVPFSVTIPDHEVDKRLGERLEGERSAILRWMLDGCLAWQRDGLRPPDTVRDATDQYLDEEDSILQFFADTGERDPNAWEASADLWNRWKAWAEGAGEFVGTRRKFTNRLVEKGLTPAVSGHSKTRGYRGLRLIYVEDGDGRYGE